jgi:hypothetical protein
MYSLTTAAGMLTGVLSICTLLQALINAINVGIWDLKSAASASELTWMNTASASGQSSKTEGKKRTADICLQIV